MIKLQKGTRPDVLTRNADTWRTDLMSLIAAGVPVPKSTQNKYNHPDVKSALKAECMSKCMYCESKVDHVCHEHIEHIRPKASGKYPELTFEWANLGLACPICNGNKGDDFDEEFPFLNPFVDHPDRHLRFVGPFIFECPGDARAEITVNNLGLNRPELLAQKKRAIDRLRGLMTRYTNETNPTLKRIARMEIERELTADNEYSACLNAIYRSLL